MTTRAFINISPTIFSAAREAMRTQHPHIGSEHVAMAAWPGEHGLEALAKERGIPTDALRSAIETCCTHPPLGADEGEPRITFRTARMWALASQVALVEGRSEVEPVDLLYALMTEPGAVAWRGLMAGGVTPDLVADWLRRYLTSVEPPKVPSAAVQ